MFSVKHKEWIGKVERVRPELRSRYNLTRLDKNERISPFNESFFKKELSKISSEELCAYPEVEPFYKQLSDHIGVNVNNLVITAGSDGAIRNCFELFVNSGDRVIFLDPTFAMVDVYCNLYDAEKFRVNYDRNLSLNISRLISGINDKTALIIIANPNSPTGTLLSDLELKEIFLKAKSFSVPVLVDEAYFGFSDYSTLNMLKEFENLIISRTFSKAYGLAGLRIGYLIANQNLADLLYKFRPMYEVNQIGVVLASKILRNFSIVENYLNEVEEGKQFFLERLGFLGFKSINTYANFVHVDLKDKLKEIEELLEKNNILAKGTLPIQGYETFLRITVGPKHIMQEVLTLLEHQQKTSC